MRIRSTKLGKTWDIRPGIGSGKSVGTSESGAEFAVFLNAFQFRQCNVSDSIPDHPKVAIRRNLAILTGVACSHGLSESPANVGSGEIAWTTLLKII